MKLNLETKYVLFIGLLIAFGFRIFHLNYDGLWNDELLTAVMSTPDNSIKDILAMLKGDVHPPLHPVLTNIFCKIFGYNDTTIRLVNVFFGVWGIYGGYLLAKELFNKKVSLYALGLLILNSFLIRYSQEARSYAQLTVFASFSFLYFARLLRNKYELRNSIFYVLATTAMLYTHYFALFAVASQFVAFFFLMNWKRFKEKLWMYVITFALPNLLFLFWMQFLLNRAEKPFSGWRDEAGLGLIIEYITRFFNDTYLMILAVSILLVSLVYLMGRKFVKSKWITKFNEDGLFGISLLMIWLVVNFFIPYIRSSFDTSMMVDRYFTPLVLPIVILIAFYISKIPLQPARNGFFILICAYSIFVLFDRIRPYYDQPNTWRETVDHLYTLDEDPHVWYLSKDRRYWRYYLGQKKMYNTRKFIGPFRELMNKSNPDTYYVLTHLRAVVPKYKDSIPVLEGYEEVLRKDFQNKNKVLDTRLIKYQRIEKVKDSL